MRFTRAAPALPTSSCTCPKFRRSAPGIGANSAAVRTARGARFTVALAFAFTTDVAFFFALGAGVFFDNLQNAVNPRPTVKGYEKMSAFVGKAISEVLQGKGDAQSALDRAAEQSAPALA